MKRSRWVITIGILITVGIVLFQILPGIMFMSGIPEPHSIPLDKEKATKLVMDFDEFGKIYELDDCQRHSKSINGIAIRLNQEESESEYGNYFKEVLENQEISESDFESFRKALEETKLRYYIRTDKYSVFIVDGFLDGVWGYLYSHNNEEVGEDYFNADIYTIRAIENLGDNWYRIAGS